MKIKIALAKHDIVVPGGSLTLTSGAAALRPKKGATIGGALNGGLITATAALADELSAKRIRVNTVVPGLVKTPLLGKLGHSEKKQQQIYGEAAERLSVGFVATPQHVAEAYLYAVRADYANGTTIVIGQLTSTFHSLPLFLFETILTVLSRRWWLPMNSSYPELMSE